MTKKTNLFKYLLIRKNNSCICKTYNKKSVTKPIELKYYTHRKNTSQRFKYLTRNFILSIVTVTASMSRIVSFIFSIFRLIKVKIQKRILVAFSKIQKSFRNILSTVLSNSILCSSVCNTN